MGRAGTQFAVTERKHGGLQSVATAQDALLALAAPLAAQRVPILDATGRYLAKPLIARRTQPPADLSAMDGYAVRGAPPWTVVGESRAGHPMKDALAAGQAAAISTGAHVPAGTESIVIKENACRSGDLIEPSDRSEKADYIRSAGEDFTVGQALIASGTQIDEVGIALALAAGLDQVTVRCAPTVGILDCGDELAAFGTVCERHQVPATNGAMLRAMVRGIGAIPKTRELIADNVAAIASAIDGYSDCDVIVTSGGASVGDHDLLQPALGAIGADTVFWRVAMKPGKPLLVATRGRQIVIGLPGNPASSYVTAFLFLLPLLRKLAGAKEPLPQSIPIPCATELSATGKRQEFVRAVFYDNAVTPLPQQGSGSIRTLAQANALIARPINSPRRKSGTYVPVYLTKNGGIA